MTHILTKSAAAVLFIGTAIPVLAQDRGRTEVSRDIATQVREEVRTLHRDLIRQITDTVRDVTVDLPNASHPDAAFSQNRDFRSEQTHRENRRLPIGASGILDLKNVS